MLETLMAKLGHKQGEKLQFLSKRICGLWLMWVAIVIFASAVFGGKQGLLQAIFYPGYFAGFVLILGNKSLYRKFAFGRPSKFQKNMTFVSIVFMFVLMVLFSGWYFQDHNYRMIWLGAFLAIAIHFVPFSFVHGKSMIILSVPLAINALMGILNPTIPFSDIAYIDAVIKLLFGIALFCSKQPRTVGVSSQRAI